MIIWDILPRKTLTVTWLEANRIHNQTNHQYTVEQRDLEIHINMFYMLL